MTHTFLTEEEIFQLTRRTRRSSQVIVLQQMSIEHRVRPDGSVAVLRDHINKIFDGQESASRTPKAIEPNWDAMR